MKMTVKKPNFKTRWILFRESRVWAVWFASEITIQLDDKQTKTVRKLLESKARNGLKMDVK